MNNTGLWLIDVQEGLFPLIDRKEKLLDTLSLMLKAAMILELPLVVTEQYPKGLGKTIKELHALLPENQTIWEKSRFSGYCSQVEDFSLETWILIGIETHICVLQTAKDLVKAKKKVIVLEDATSSRSFDHHKTAIGELRDCGVRLSCLETVLYELIEDANSPKFKQILPLIKRNA